MMNHLVSNSLFTKNAIFNLVKKAQRYGYLFTQFKTLDELRQEVDENLFHSTRYNPHHVLHRLVPQIKDSSYKLRQRAHNLTLPSDVSLTVRQNFMPGMSFMDMC